MKTYECPYCTGTVHEGFFAGVCDTCDTTFPLLTIQALEASIQAFVPSLKNTLNDTIPRFFAAMLGVDDGPTEE